MLISAFLDGLLAEIIGHLPRESDEESAEVEDK